jgi:hypothetical protein
MEIPEFVEFIKRTNEEFEKLGTLRRAMTEREELKQRVRELKGNDVSCCCCAEPSLRAFRYCERHFYMFHGLDRTQERVDELVDGMLG